MFQDINTFAEWLLLISGMIGSMITIGSALIWVTKKIYLEPKDKKKIEAERIHRENMEAVSREQTESIINPVASLVEELRNWTLESIEDRKQLNSVAEINTRRINKHEEVLHNHDDRLIVVETKIGVDGKRQMSVREEYGRGAENEIK